MAYNPEFHEPPHPVDEVFRAMIESDEFEEAAEQLSHDEIMLGIIQLAAKYIADKENF